MTHVCRNCGAQYEDGNNTVLNGCTECGSNKFQYVAEDTADTPTGTSSETPPENTAQHQARTGFVDTNETSPSDESDSSDILIAEEETDVDESDQVDTDSTEDIDKVKEQLNQHFESIKVIEPGRYELNLMKMYENEDHVVELQEDGCYVVRSPGSSLD